MADNVYECLFLFDPNRYARDPNTVSGSIGQMVESVGGEILASRLWNEQKLAYPINGHRKGTYWLTYFRLESGKLGEFNRACQLNDAVMRNLVLKVDPRLVEALVAHAQGKSTAAPEAEAAKEAAPAETTEKSESAEPAEST